MTSEQLVLGIDGGGTKTAAWLACCGPAADFSVIGRAVAGPANPQTVGFARALENLAQAVAAACCDAAVEIHPFAAAVVALAGSDRDENRRILHEWAEQRRLARRFRVVDDALPVLIAGSPDGSGVALICGTGSMALGRTQDGRTARAGGWGRCFGDEGSGYAMAVAGLRAAAKCADGRGPATQLLEGLLDRLSLQHPPQLIPAISHLAADPAAIAALAEVVTTAADQGDPVAQRIVSEAAGELAAMVAAVVRALDLPRGRGYVHTPCPPMRDGEYGRTPDPPVAAGFPLALAGGALLGSENLRNCLKTQLCSLSLSPGPVAEVPEPVLGALKLAQADAAGQ